MVHTESVNDATSGTVGTVVSTTQTAGAVVDAGIQKPMNTQYSDNRPSNGNAMLQTAANVNLETLVQNVTTYVSSFFTRHKGAPITEETIDGMLIRLQRICYGVVKE